MCVAAMVGLFIGGLSLTGLIATLIVVILVSLMNGVCARIFTMRVLSDEQNEHFSITQIASVIGIICNRSSFRNTFAEYCKRQQSIYA